MRVGIYGGTFSPIHNGHVAAALAFMEQMWLYLLFVVPTGQSPHKQMSNGATASDRLNMCRLAFEGHEGIIVSDTEIKRNGKSYTVDTLREFYREDDRLFMLCGTDMMLSLDSWYQPQEIFRLCYPVYIRREDDEETKKRLIEKNAEYKKKYGKIVTRINAPAVVISSEEIRKKIKEGQSIHGLVPEKVEEYIYKQRLYL